MSDDVDEFFKAIESGNFFKPAPAKPAPVVPPKPVQKPIAKPSSPKPLSPKAKTPPKPSVSPPKPSQALEDKPDLNDKLLEACEKGTVEDVKNLVNRGADPKYDENAPILQASMYGKFDIVRFLIEQGADFRADNDATLYNACKYGDLALVKFLVENGADLHAENEACLYDAVFFDHLDVVEFLVGQGADINARNGKIVQIAKEEGRENILNYFKTKIQIEEDEQDTSSQVAEQSEDEQDEDNQDNEDNEDNDTSYQDSEYAETCETDSKAVKWWENLEKKTGPKWSVLKHNGVLFPPPYEPIKIPILYDGKPMYLDGRNTNNPFNISAEEGAVFLAMKMEQDDRLAEKNSKRKKSINDPVFVNNFWKDWKIILGPNSPIKDFSKVNLKPIQDYISKRSEQKKIARANMSKEEKKIEKTEKEGIKNIYGWVYIDGVKIALGNYMVQPPGLYMGHGEHPLRGRIKKRIQPEDVTLNVSKDSVPKCFTNGKPCKWGGIVEMRNVVWIANWKNPITQDLNYVWLSRTESHFVCAGDMKKFDTARKLGKNINDIRKKYGVDMISGDASKREFATATYLLDMLAIRPGVTKDEEKESPTLGLTTLKIENISLEGNNTVTIDFSGKSSIQFTRTFKVAQVAYANLSALVKGKNKKSLLFPTLNATSLNKYLKTLLPELTAKTFRTYTAGRVLQDELDKTIPDVNASMHTKKLMFDKANQKVAIALNHKNMTTSDEKEEKLKEKITALKQKRKEAKTPKQKETVDKNIELAESKLEQAQGNISLTTSKVNYIDPRCIVSWCKRNEMAIEKIYTKTYLKKFVWSFEVPSMWRF
jgi:DNA topoisomerase-1